MAANWFKLFNQVEWIEEDLVSRSLVLDLKGRGQTRFHITQGNTTAVQYDDKFLPVNFLDQNPYVQDGCAVYLDGNDDVWFGFED